MNSVSEFDITRFAAEVVVQGAEGLAARATDNGVARKLRRIYHQITDSYAPYLEKTYRRVSTVRTFLRPNESLELLGVYVPVDLTNGRESIEASGLLEKLHAGQSCVVTALAGRGKSVLMRYVALSMYHNPRGKIPLFIELRSLNTLTTKNILQLLHSQYQGEEPVRFEDFLAAIDAGYFCLILDGFDEVSPQDRANVEGQILDILDRYPGCPIVVSGRNDPRYNSWEQVTTYYLKAMGLAQTRDLIEKAPYDEDVKRTFLRRLTPPFFSKHESFLNTPLLAIMLMLTFEEYAEIPNSLHEFYRNAFDTLVRRHDALKSQFLRETHSGCTAEEFKQVFSSFCVLTYTKNATRFRERTHCDISMPPLVSNG